MVRKLEAYLADEAKRSSDDRDPLSRTEVRREQQRIEAEWLILAKQLTTLKPSRLEHLQLTPAQLEIIDEIRVIESLPARHRALKQLRAALRDEDLEVFARRLSALTDPAHPPMLDAAKAWQQRLASGNDAELSAFVSQYPETDRAQLRTLVRNATRAGEQDRTRAANKLIRALQQAMRAKAVAESGEPDEP